MKKEYNLSKMKEVKNHYPQKAKSHVKHKFPSEKELNAVRKKLSRKQGTLALPENPTPLEKFRYDIQQKFVIYKRVHKLSQREMAAILEIDEGKVSKILRNRLSEFATDRLITLYERINPKIKLKVI